MSWNKGKTTEYGWVKIDMQTGIEELSGVMDRLLGEGGCPWDREQTHTSLKEFLIEECYEVLDAIDRDNTEDMCEELGDVLLQVMFHAKLAEQAGRFNFDDVARRVSLKMISRHPHIFGNATADTPEAVLQNWEAIKREEKQHETILDSIRAVPKNLPALMYARKVVKKSLKMEEKHFSKRETADMLESLAQCLRSQSENESDLKMENIGEILLQIAYLSAIMQINPELSLTNAVETYINKLEDFERPRGTE